MRNVTTWTIIVVVGLFLGCLDWQSATGAWWTHDRHGADLPPLVCGGGSPPITSTDCVVASSGCEMNPAGFRNCAFYLVIFPRPFPPTAVCGCGNGGIIDTRVRPTRPLDLFEPF